MTDSRSAYRVGVDVGGTFTDVFSFDGVTGRFEIAKVASTPGAQADGFMSGIDASGAPAASIETVVHGTTVATNAILERKGAKCGLVATRGFRDALELGRRTRPNRWGLTGSFEALIPRELRLDVTERMDAQGRVVTPLDEDELRDAVITLRAAGCEALVIHNEAGVPAARVRTLDEALASEQVASRPVLGEYATAHMPHARPRPAVAGFACSADGPALHGAPPELGRHTTEILADLGYGPEDISALEREGVVQLPIVGRFAGESCPDAIGDRR